jgi:hypothetical protein
MLLAVSGRRSPCGRNENPQPFVWHKTADEILESMAGYLQRIYDAGYRVRSKVAVSYLNQRGDWDMSAGTACPAGIGSIPAG